MVEALRDMEVAAALLAPTAAPSSLRGLYKQLNCGVQPVDDGATLQMLRDLLAHGQGPTHREWTLRLDAAFAVQRAGEATRFQPFTQLPNHQLLFHGSRLANFIGILTHGVRIAPKEAPATGAKAATGGSWVVCMCFCMATRWWLGPIPPGRLDPTQPSLRWPRDALSVY
jgi:hypothetical protein